MSESTIDTLPTLIATSVVRGSEQGQSHGGIYLLHPGNRDVRQVLDWNTADIDWSGRGWDRGLRGIAYHNDEVYIAASDELFVYDRYFNRLRSHRNPYLRHCHEISVHRDVLYLSSTGFDSILAFDLQRRQFTWGMFAREQDGTLSAFRYDPNGSEGPPPGNRLHINNVVADDRGLCFSGLRTQGIIALAADARLVRQVALPAGVHNARLTDDGVLFNDTASDVLRYVRRDGRELKLPYPRYAEGDLQGTDLDDSRIARQAFGRGLCMISDTLVAAGSSPSTVTIYDLARECQVLSVNFSMDIRNAIHGLAVWPFSDHAA